MKHPARHPIMIMFMFIRFQAELETL